MSTASKPTSSLRVSSKSLSCERSSLSKKKSELKPVTHVIFDLDGLLMDTEPIELAILNEICGQYNRGPIPDELQVRIRGRNEKDVLNLLINEMKFPIRFPLMKQKVNKLEDDGRYRKSRMFPGAEVLMCHLTRNKIPIALVTSSRMETVQDKLHNYKGLCANFHHIVSGSSDPDVPMSKPDPTIYRVCAERFDGSPDPESCLVLEDSPAGVSAACCAGMQVVAIPCAGVEPTDLVHATLVLEKLTDFKPEKFGLPKIPR